MNPGELNRRISFQAKVSGYDADGYPVVGDQIVKTLWADVVPLTSREFFQSQQTNTEITTRFIVRYRKDLNTKMTILYDSKKYEIVSILEDAKKTTLTLIGKIIV
jgi:SPP1 family predicted phage head-tail adaptor